MIEAIILLVAVLVLLAIRQNVVVVLIFVGAYTHLVWGEGQLVYLVEDMWISLNNEVLLAIPIFLIAGNLMTRGSIARRLINITRVATCFFTRRIGRRDDPVLCAFCRDFRVVTRHIAGCWNDPLSGAD